MANFNETFTVPADGEWHPIAVIGGATSKWLELTVEAGAGRIAVCAKRIPPNAGQPLRNGERTRRRVCRASKRVHDRFGQGSIKCPFQHRT